MAKNATADKKKLGAYWIPIELLERFVKYSDTNKIPMSRIVTQLISDFLAQNEGKMGGSL